MNLHCFFAILFLSFAVFHAEENFSYRNTLYATTPLAEKPWTVMIFIAGDNDLAYFINRNIQQMVRVGSTPYLNIVICVIESPHKNKKRFQILYIEKNSTKIIFETTDKDFLDSGDPKNLSFFCKTAISLFPAQNYGLILWNHGTGALDLQQNNIIRMKHFFIPGLFKNDTDAVRIPSFLNIQLQENTPQKGICFDDTTGNNLSEQKLITALNDIVHQYLKGAKLSFIGCDACFMGAIEIASLFKSYAHLMIASEESEPGPGWNYERVFSPFLFGVINKETFGKHIVQSYQKTYQSYPDHTLSCINLSTIETIEILIKKLSCLLQKALALQCNKSVFHAIATSKAKHTCTHFDEPSFIDLEHFCKNIINNVPMINLHNKNIEPIIKNDLIATAQQIIATSQQAVIANVAGAKYSCAQGLSLYFPEFRIHRPYRSTIFSCATDWSSFLTLYHQHR